MLLLRPSGGLFKESLSVLTTRRSTRTVVLWTGAEESSLSLSLTCTFMHLSLFRFPHCNTKSGVVVCLVPSELALNTKDPSPPPPLTLLLLRTTEEDSLSISSLLFHRKLTLDEQSIPSGTTATEENKQASFRFPKSGSPVA